MYICKNTQLHHTMLLVSKGLNINGLMCVCVFSNSVCLVIVCVCLKLWFCTCTITNCISITKYSNLIYQNRSGIEKKLQLGVTRVDLDMSITF